MKQKSNKLNQKLTYIILLIIMSLTFLSSCSNTNIGSTATLREVYVGREGVITTLQNPNVLTNFFSGSTLPVILRVENKGAYNIRNGLVYIEYDKSFFESVSDSTFSFNLAGKNQFADGEFTIADLELSNYGLSTPSSSKNSYLIVKTCYPYITKLTSDLCFGNPNSKGCSYDNYKTLSGTSQGQGAPIVINQITENVVETQDGFEIYLDIFIDNPTNQLITLPQQATSLCVGSESIQSLNKVQIDYVKVSDEDILDECLLGSMDSNVFDLSRRHFVCRLKRSKSEYTSSFVAPLSIQLSYGFTQVDRYTISFSDLGSSLLK